MDRAALRHHAPTCVSSSSSAFLDIRSILFAGVNTDQCVMCTLQDANFLGYGCILVEDCCATSSPDFCTQATVWNVKKCFGFVTDSGRIIESVKIGRASCRERVCQYV